MGRSRGRDLYNRFCYFCHGYSGDAQTVAAQMLSPPPRDFTRSTDLSEMNIVETLRTGRDGTAMQAFSKQMSAQDMRDVAAFVTRAFVECQDTNTRYHTAANGWPDHETRYGAAVPFATGE